MLGDKNVTATIAVKDIENAKQFYEQVLGLTSIGSEDAGGVMYKCGDSKLFVYASEYAGTNQATYVSWEVGDDIKSVIDGLKSRGVQFETYDLPNATREEELHIMGDLRAAWFKDPDGNILNIVNKS